MADKNKTPAAPAATTPAPVTSVAELQAALDAANRRISELTAAKVQDEELEEQIAKKAARGLSRSQAAAVIRRQAEFDQSPEGKAHAKAHQARQDKLKSATA